MAYVPLINYIVGQWLTKKQYKKIVNSEDRIIQKALKAAIILTIWKADSPKFISYNRRRNSYKGENVKEKDLKALAMNGLYLYRMMNDANQATSYTRGLRCFSCGYMYNEIADELVSAENVMEDHKRRNPDCEVSKLISYITGRPGDKRKIINTVANFVKDIRKAMSILQEYDYANPATADTDQRLIEMAIMLVFLTQQPTAYSPENIRIVLAEESFQGYRILLEELNGLEDCQPLNMIEDFLRCFNQEPEFQVPEPTASTMAGRRRLMSSSSDDSDLDSPHGSKRRASVNIPGNFTGAAQSVNVNEQATLAYGGNGI